MARKYTDAQRAYLYRLVLTGSGIRQIEEIVEASGPEYKWLISIARPSAEDWANVALEMLEQEDKYGQEESDA